jgi:VIT1/CCC1 family predicted Fe2+/Mn2+ transporter
VRVLPLWVGSLNRDVALRYCREEGLSLAAYEALASLEKDEGRRSVLKKLAEDEKRHFEFWRSLAGVDCEPSPLRVLLLKLSYSILGPLFTIKLMEKSEEEAVREYSSLLESVGEGWRQGLLDLIKDEEVHEKELMAMLTDPRLRYIGFIALGLADAIVEMTGVNAGFLGATGNTIAVGLAGLIVGFSAALSMAGAAYLQSKHEARAQPVKSSLATGLAYILTVIILVAPFFLVTHIVAAFTASVTASILLTGLFTYYSSVVEDKDFKREFAESLVLLLGIAFASYGLGEAINKYVGFPRSP